VIEAVGTRQIYDFMLDTINLHKTGFLLHSYAGIIAHFLLHAGKGIEDSGFTRVGISN